MTLNPKISIYLNVILSVLMALAGCAAAFTDLLGQRGTVIVMAGLAVAIAVVNAVLHAIPSQTGAAGAAQFPLGPAVAK